MPQLGQERADRRVEDAAFFIGSMTSKTLSNTAWANGAMDRHPAGIVPFCRLPPSPWSPSHPLNTETHASRRTCRTSR